MVVAMRPHATMNQNNDKSRDNEREERQLAWAANVLHATKGLNAIGPAEQVVDELIKATLGAYVRFGDRGTQEFFQSIKNRCQATFEARRVLLLARRAELCSPGALDELIDEADILMRMDFSAIRTMEQRRGSGAPAGRGFESPPGAEEDVPFDGWRGNGAGAAESKASPAARPRRPAAR